jgi:hypothetical protein
VVVVESVGSKRAIWFVLWEQVVVVVQCELEWTENTIVKENGGLIVVVVMWFEWHKWSN